MSDSLDPGTLSSAAASPSLHVELLEPREPGEAWGYFCGRCKAIWRNFEDQEAAAFMAALHEATSCPRRQADDADAIFGSDGAE